MKHVFIPFIMLCINIATAFSQTSIFSYGSTWKSLDNGSNQGTAWMQRLYGKGHKQLYNRYV